MSELTKEQLLEYVKKQKLKMKKLETEIATLKEKTDIAVVSNSSSDELNNFKMENESLEKQVQNKELEIADLSKTIGEMEDEKIRIVSEKNTEIARLTKLADLSAASGNEKADLHCRIAELEAVISSQKVQISDYEGKMQQFASLQASIQSMQNEGLQSAAQINQLQAELLDVRSRADSLDGIVVTLNQQISELSASRDEAVASLQSGSSAEGQLREELSTLQSKCTALSEQLSSSALECESLKSTNTELSNASAVVTKELATTKDELVAKLATLEHANSQIRELSNKLEEASKTVSPAPAAVPESPKVIEKPALEAAGAAAGKKKGKNNKKGKGKGSDTVDSATPTAEEVAEAPAVLDAPEADPGLLEELQQKLLNQAEKHAQEVQCIEAALAEAQAAGAASATELQALSAQLSKVNAEVAEYAVRCSAWKAREGEFLSQAAALETANSTLKQELHVASAQSSSSQQEREGELTSLKVKIAELEAAVRTGEAAELLSKQQVQDLQAEQAEQGHKLAKSSDRLAALEAQLQQATDESTQHRTALAAKTQEVEELRSEVESLKLSGDSSATERADALDVLNAELRTAQAQLEAAQVQLATAQTAEKALADELTALKEASALTESTNKKLMTKLKLKMKECTDLSAELAAAKETVTKSASAEATSSALTEQLQALQASLKKVSTDKAELEAKSKSLNDSVIAGEEKVSALLREKNKLQEDLFATLHKVEGSAKEAQGFKTERDLARQQYLDVESKLQSLSNSTRERIDSLSAKVTELTASNATLSSQNITLNEALALSNSEITTLKESSSALSQANSKSKGLAATVETLKQQLQDAKADADSKAEASNERIKKLKLLLTKVNAVSQEKDTRLAQLQTLSDRAKKFNIVTRIGVVPPQDPAAEPLEWCLIYEHRAAPAKNSTPAAATEDSDSTSQYRWIEARTAHKWMAEGSTLVGAWPQPVQETWSTEMSTLRSRLEAERDDMASKFEEISSQFQTYKVRAQTALKRIGNEDRNERQKAQEVESAEIERLRGVIQDLKEKEGDFNEVLSEKERAIATKQQAIQELQAKIEGLETTIADGEAAHKATERKIGTLQKEIEALVEDSKNMKEQYEAADRNNRERRMLQLRTEEEAALRLATMPQPAHTAIPSRNSGQNLQDQSQLDSAESDATSIAPGPSPTRPMSPNDLIANGANGASVHAHSSGVSPLRVVSRTPSQTIAAGISPRGRSLAVEAALSSEVQDGGASSDNKLLLFQQADQILRDSIAILRLENSQLMVEINEIKNDVGLREDQVLALKNTIRELESSLCREKEFNAENRRINADYLVNILRNFLMSTEPSERAKLVPVLCQILHLRADESKIIAEKWAVRGGGLVGWLLPQRPAVVSTATPRYQQHATGMSIDRGGDANGKGSGDLTYDPATGGGIDVNSY